MKILFFDLETTGTNFWQHGIHQLAGVVDIDGKAVERFDFKIAPNPAAKIEAEALAVAGVSLETVKAYPPMQEVFPKFIELLAKYVDRYNKRDKFHLAGYNSASFDNPFLRAWFKQNGDPYFGSWFWSNPVDVFVLAGVELMKDRHKLEDFKLRSAAKALGLEVDDKRLHDAAYDIELTRAMFYLLQK